MEETVQSKEVIYKKPSISKEDFISKLQLSVDEKKFSRETTAQQQPIIKPKYSKVADHESPLIKHTVIENEDIPMIDLRANAIHM